MKTLIIDIIHQDHTKVILRNEKGNTFTYNPMNEGKELNSFLLGAKPLEYKLKQDPSDTKEMKAEDKEKCLQIMGDEYDCLPNESDIDFCMVQNADRFEAALNCMQSFAEQRVKEELIEYEEWLNPWNASSVTKEAVGKYLNQKKQSSVCPECGYPKFKKSFEDFERCNGCNWTSNQKKG